MVKILLFDVDGTLCDSGKKINSNITEILDKFVKMGVEIGIVGGGTFEKILFQLDNLIKPDYIFSECGSVYHKLNSNMEYLLVNKNNLRLEPEYVKINSLVKTSLKFISEVDYMVSGHFVDLRNGLIYISLVGMVGSDEERENFIELDKIYNYRTNLIDILKKQAKQLDLDDYLDICLGGSVGIAIYPKKWNKVQVLKWFDLDGLSNLSNSQIHFFGDKYLPDGNDYELINNKNIIPHPVDSTNDTFKELTLLLEKN
jgi:phosphomannomutase